VVECCKYLIHVGLHEAEIVELQKLLGPWLEAHEIDRFCEAHEGFTPENRLRSDRLHILSYANDALTQALVAGWSRRGCREE